MGVEISDILQVDNIFTKKRWDKELPHMKEAYEKTFLLIEKLEADEKKLFLDLLQFFEKYDFNQQNLLLFEVIKLIPAKRFEQYDSILFVPIKFPLDSTASKSADGMPYDIRTMVTPFADHLEEEKCEYLSSPLELLERTLDDKTLIIALDDFFGSGSTVHKFYKALSKDITLEKGNIIFVSLVAMRQGIERLNNNGYEIYSKVIKERGISDNPFFSCKITALRILREMTSRLDTNIKNYRGGYKSEALLSMQNTPNNTLPIFWADSMRDGEKWPAPFKRIR